jgi:hypothetical protein
LGLPATRAWCVRSAPSCTTQPPQLPATQQLEPRTACGGQGGAHIGDKANPRFIVTPLSVHVRRVKLAMSQASPNLREFIAAFHALRAAAR